jgi:serine/threonine protein kinase
MAPERIEGIMDNDVESNKRADLWSIGIIIYILVCGRAPFEAKTTEDLVEKIKKGDFLFNGREWDNIPTIKKFIMEFLTYEPLERTEACMAANNEYLTKILL